MGLKNIFARRPRGERLAKLDPANKFHVLDNAVGRGDLDAVKEALAAGADPSYRDRTHFGSRPFEKALQRNRLDIFKAMLESPGSDAALRNEHASEGSVLLKKGAADQAFFTPGYLYRAIQMGREDFALALAEHPAVDIEYAGWIFRTNNGTARGHWTQYIPLVKPVIDLARERGMKKLVEVLTQRMHDEADQKRRAAAEKRRAEADDLRAQAAALLEKAEMLDPTSPKQPPKPGKLNI